MASAALTTRRAVVADAEMMVRNAILGIATWRAFTPADWTGPTAGHRVEMTRYFLSRSDAFGLLADVAGEPAGHFLMFRATWDEPNSVILGQHFVRPAWWGTGLAEHLHAAFVERARADGYPLAWLATPAAHARARRFYERRGWRADTLLEEHEGLAMAIYGLRLGS